MSVRIRIQGDLAHVSSSDAVLDRMPYLTAVVEAKGGLLHWDPTEPAVVPDADIDDTDAATGWLADLYGQEVADAVGRSTDASADAVVRIGQGDRGVIDGVLRLGHLTWAQAWWPAGAGIPALDPAVLAAEIAVSTHVVEHLLDDESAVERAVEDAVDAPSALAALPAAFTREGEHLLTVLSTLAEDHGVALESAEGGPAGAESRREEWTLAAGGTHGAALGVEVASGSAPVRWCDVPPQTVAADDDAAWVIRRHAGSAVLQVEVPAVDAPGSGRMLRARFGPAALGVEVELRRETTLFRGEAEVAASALFLPADQRTLWVRDPVLSPGDELIPEDEGAPDPVAARERVLSFAASQLLSPTAPLAERAAGAQR